MYVCKFPSGSFPGREVFLCSMNLFGGITKREKWTRSVDCATAFPSAEAARKALDELCEQERFRAPEQNLRLQDRVKKAEFLEVSEDFMSSFTKHELFIE